MVCCAQNPRKNLNMVSDSALSRTNRRMTSSKYDCQPLVGGRRLQRVTTSGLPVDPGSYKGLRWRSDRQPATRSRVRRLKAVKPAAAQRSRCSPCCATPHDPTTGRLPMTHQGWDLNRPGFSGGAVPLVAWGRMTGISCHGGWVLELYRGQHAQVSCGGAG